MATKKQKTFYWITTSILFLFEGVIPAFTSNSQLAVEGIRHLGYPDYFRTMLTVFKVCGATAIMLPFISGRVKEWAYAGFSFTIISATVSSIVVDGLTVGLVMPVVFLFILVVSYKLYPLITGHSKAGAKYKEENSLLVV